MSTVEFGTLFRFIRNGMNVKQGKSGDGMPITRIETISDATVDRTRVGFAGLQEADCRDWFLETGDILFSQINSVEYVGKCAVYRGKPEKLVHGMNLLCLRSDTAKLLPEFAKYLMRGTEFRTRLSNFINKAVNQASVSIGNLKTIPVTVPPLAEQRRIAEVLDRAEALRAKRRAALAQLDSLTQSLFLDIFGKPKENPKGSPLVPLMEICSPKQWPTISTPELTATGFPVFGVNGLIGRYTEYNHEEPTVLITCRGATCGTINVSPPKCYVTGNAMALDNPDPKRITIEYLAAVLRMRSMADTISGTAQPQITRQNLQHVTLPLPPIPLQRKFARRVTAVEALKTAQRASLAELDALFATLQHRAFRGEL